MIRLSTGIVEETLCLISMIRKYNCWSFSQIRNERLVSGVDQRMAAQFAQQMNWVKIDDDSILMSEDGESFLRRFHDTSISAELWRDIIKDFIIRTCPIWANRIPSGRQETYNILSPDEKRCFLMAGLMNNDVDLSIQQWWDSLAELYRAKKNERLDVIGRKGERCTLGFEKLRVDADPIWKSFETNAAGYDVLSIVEKGSEKKLLIEVKATVRDSKTACFTLTRNEWDVARTMPKDSRYLFYLWMFDDDDKKLAIVDAEAMSSHIPLDVGSGKWETLDIPFFAFEDDFFEVVL